MKYFMLDIETLSTSITKCPIVQIACIYADSDQDPFFAPRYVADVRFDPAQIDPSTVYWHMGQSASRTREFFNPNRPNAKRQYNALQELGEFATSVADDGAEPPQPKFWCKGPSFDFAILEEKYRERNSAPPWKYWATRDCRTLIETCELLHPEFVQPKRDITALPTHDALSDCIYQAQVHNAVLQQMGIN